MKRDFTAAGPNELWMVDFPYVPAWAGMAFTAFVSDVFSRRVVGWRTCASMPTELPLGPRPSPRPRRAGDQTWRDLRELDRMNLVTLATSAG